MKKIQIKGPVISDSDGKFMEFWGDAGCLYLSFKGS